MINDKRIDALNEEIDSLKERIKQQAKTIIERDRTIRDLRAENGILERTIDIYVVKLSKAREEAKR